VVSPFPLGVRLRSEHCSLVRKYLSFFVVKWRVLVHLSGRPTVRAILHGQYAAMTDDFVYSKM